MRLPAFLAALALLAATAGAQQLVSNPAYEAWARFKPGAFSKLVGSTKTMGMENGQEITTRLVEVKPDKVIVEVSRVVTAAGERIDSNNERMEIAATIPSTEQPVKMGEETITINGETLACRVLGAERKQDNNTIATRSWWSDKVPGGVVRVEGQTGGAVASDTRLELKEYKAD